MNANTLPRYHELVFTKHQRAYCFIRAKTPCAVELLLGEPAKPLLEELEITTLDLQMLEDRGGLKLPDFVGNTQFLLVWRKSCADALGELDLGKCEVLPARLINEKKRVHSDDYVVVNPLGQVECLDVSNTDLSKDTEDGPRVRPFGKFSLFRVAIPAKLDLFRAKGVGGFICSDRFVQLVEKRQLTNFTFKPVQLS